MKSSWVVWLQANIFACWQSSRLILSSSLSQRDVPELNLMGQKGPCATFEAVLWPR